MLQLFTRERSLAFDFSQGLGLIRPFPVLVHEYRPEVFVKDCSGKDAEPKRDASQRGRAFPLTHSGFR